VKTKEKGIKNKNKKICDQFIKFYEIKKKIKIKEKIARKNI